MGKCAVDDALLDVCHVNLILERILHLFLLLRRFPQPSCLPNILHKTVKEAKQLIEAGFEYVTDMNGVKLFRKLKTSYLGTVPHPS